MRDLQTLRQRIAQADKHFRAAEEARHREGESLLQTWDELRQRFTDQQQEIARYRARVETLVEANDELAAMVDRLIATVEGSARRAREEPAPQIKSLAQQLLGGEPSADEMAEMKRALATAEAEAEPGDAPDGPEASIPVEPPPGNGHAAGDQGIRTLVERIEGFADKAMREGKAGAEPTADEDDDLARELQEIETLRNELSGLRDRIATDGRSG